MWGKAGKNGSVRTPPTAVHDEEEMRDQEYTRPKVLILLPTPSIAYDFVRLLISLLGLTPTAPLVENLRKFEAEFGPVTVPEINTTDRAATVTETDQFSGSCGSSYDRRRQPVRCHGRGGRRGTRSCTCRRTLIFCP